MTTYIWAIDTPWAKKGTLLSEGEEVQMTRKLGTHYWFEKPCISEMIDLGWIKPVEDKKLTEEEVLEAITTTSRSSTGIIVSSLSIYKLAKFLAEHLK